MAATLLDPPNSPAYNGNDLWTLVSSDLQTASAGYIDIEFSASGPSIGQILTIEWNGNTATFTVAATTNDTATAIPVKGAESLADYTLIVAEVFRENYLTSDSFYVEAFTGANRVVLTFKTAGLLDITTTENLDGTAVTTVDGTVNAVDNLAAQLQIWKAGETFSEDQLIVSLHSPYEVTAETEFNLRGLFPVAPALPLESSIGLTLSLSWKRGSATGTWCEYYLRLADKYGTPAVPGALVRSASNYLVFHGARPEDHDSVVTESAARIQLHGYRRADGGIFRKPVTDVQPDWAYIYTKVQITGCSVEFEVTWSDGTVTIESTSGSAFTLIEKTVYWIRSTPYDAGAITPPSPGLLPWYYTFRLLGDAGSGEQTIHEVDYVIRPCTEWDTYLLFDNGLGGCESALFRGKTAFGFSGKRDTARRARTSDFTIKEGEILTFNPEAQKVFELNSGWHDLYYIQHLRQLLMADVWLIDTLNNRFLKLVVETDSITVNESDQELFSLNITAKTAWFDHAQNP